MKRWLITLIAGCLLASSPVLAQDSKKDVDVTFAARHWLDLTDNADYGNSWETASASLKAAVTSEQFEQSLKAVRTPLGAVLSRSELSRHYSQTLPGAPDGEYVVIQYQTSFENKKSSLETLTLMREEDGEWRTAGYYIK